jgi:adenylate cyclase
MLRDRRLAALFGVSLLLTALIFLAYGFGALRSLELSSVDKRFKLRGTTIGSAAKDVVLVKIDDVTFSDLNQRWPFPRSEHAQLIDTLKADGAKVIVMDIQFTEPSEDPAEDSALLNSVGNAGNVVLATAEADERGRTRVLGGDDTVASVNAVVGNSLFPEDTGAVIRRFERTRAGIPTLPIAAAVRAGAKVDKTEFGRDGDGTAWIDYAGPPGTVKSISYSTVLNGKAPKNFFKNKVVVVGATDPVLQDVHRTSTSGESEMAGPEIQANAITTVINGFRLHGAPTWFNCLLILLLGFATPLASLKFGPRGAFAAALSTAVFFTFATFIVFNAGWITLYVYPMLALVLSTIAAVGVNFVAASYERERVRDVFSRFVSDQVVDQVLAESGNEGVKLGGKRIESTILFSDLRGFTSFAEKLPPEEVIEVLNRYLTEMSDAILDNNGTLVSFMGDGIMAVFGAPITNNNHADQGLLAAREMLARMRQFNQWMEEQGLGEGFKMGIGLKTGIVMSGNVGSERRLEYTAIGDTTNTGARLEALTKGTPYQLYMSGTTRDALSEQHDDIEFVEELPIRGRDEHEQVYGLVETDRRFIPEK